MRIGFSLFQTGNDELDFAFGLAAFQFVGDGAGNRTEVNRFRLQQTAGYARKIQQVINQLDALTGASDMLDQLFRPGVEFSAILFQEDISESVQGIDRAAQNARGRKRNRRETYRIA
jgi:hypothetical protein